MVGFYMMQFFSLAMILNNLLSTSIKEANKNYVSMDLSMYTTAIFKYMRVCVCVCVCTGFTFAKIVEL